MTDNINVPDYMPVLSRGNHADPAEGACIMEMVTVLSGEEFSDMPKCVDSGLRRAAISVNDFVSDDNRAKIALMVPRFIGTKLDHEKSNDLLYKVSDRLKTDSRFDFLYENKNAYSRGGTVMVLDIVSNLSSHFKMTQDESKRKTNEEYDDLAIAALEIHLDEFDKMTGRGEYEFTLEDAFEKFSAHVSQTKVVSEKAVSEKVDA